MKRLLLIVLGFVFIGLAIIGYLMPGIPATPWALAASYCFSKSSPRLHRWLLRLPVLGPLIHDWEMHRGVRPAVKLFACLCVIGVISSTILFVNVPPWIKWCIGVAGALGLCVIVFVVRTVRPAAVAEFVPLQLPRFPDER
jgi:uncharacterized protein